MNTFFVWVSFLRFLHKRGEFEKGSAKKCDGRRWVSVCCVLMAHLSKLEVLKMLHVVLNKSDYFYFGSYQAIASSVGES